MNIHEEKSGDKHFYWEYRKYACEALHKQIVNVTTSVQMKAEKKSQSQMKLNKEFLWIKDISLLVG